MGEQVPTKSVHVRLRTPNPLFEKWLLEWHKNEELFGNETIYSKALDSLIKYPLVLNSGLECIILEHFDQALCIKLDQKLNQHEASGALYGPSLNNDGTPPKFGDVLGKNCRLRGEKVVKPRGEPTKPRGGRINSQRGRKKGIPKRKEATILNGGQITIPVGVASNHCGQHGNPSDEVICLEEEESTNLIGNPVIKRGTKGTSKTSIQILSNPQAPELRDVSENSSSQSQEFDTEEMVFLPNTFEIILLVDTAETCGVGRRSEDKLLDALQSTSTTFEVRALKAGDYLWIARDNIGREMVLPYILERKRLDDLGKSIKDHRYRKQKRKMKCCGLPNKMYLIENTGHDMNGLPSKTLRKAVSNTSVRDKFRIVRTDNLSDSVAALARMTASFSSIFKNKTLFSCKKENLPQTVNFDDDIVSLLSFNDFTLGIKRMVARSKNQMFAKMLLCLRGISAQKARAITAQYPTPHFLIRALLQANSNLLLSDLTFGDSVKRIGPKISSALSKFYTKELFIG